MSKEGMVEYVRALDIESSRLTALILKRDATIGRIKALCDERDRIGFVTVEIILAALEPTP